jgi:hypothetical protein
MHCWIESLYQIMIQIIMFYKILYWMWLQILFGTDRFPWRFLFLLGSSYATGCPQKQTWWLEASSLQMPIFVYLVAARFNQLITYSFHVVFSAPCGRWFGLGLTSHRSTLNSYQIIFFSLLSLQAVSERDDISCSWFGSSVCGLCGIKEIIDCSEIQSVPYLNYWTKLKCILIGGWRLRTIF